MSKKVFCTTCNNIGYPKKKQDGNALILLVLLLAFLIPGIIYFLWMLTATRKICKFCKSDSIIPADSPRAQKMLRLQ